MMPMMLLTALSVLSIGTQEIDGQRLGTADRLSVTLTLLLTAVAYKFIVASLLPQVSYQTTLDWCAPETKTTIIAGTIYK